MVNQPLVSSAAAASFSLIFASGLDFIIGDPWDWLHPVQVMGWVISWWRDLTFRYLPSGLAQKISGIALNLFLLTVSAASAWYLIDLASQLSVWSGILVESIILASCFAGSSLRRAASEVLIPLQQNNLVEARLQLSKYVGRDTVNLSQSDILRALIETIAENTTDGAIAPLFFALIGGAPLAIAYKAASTLDSMVGYIDPPYTDLGWFSAKFEDCLSWLPCRFTVASIALLSGKPIRVWQWCKNDAPKDPSPNSGWSECAFAAGLGLQLGGENTYKNKIKFKPLLGQPLEMITVDQVKRSLQLMRYSLLFLLSLGLLIKFLIVVV
jgi:adenosylcobinamide-phosphate synthase